VTCSFQPLDKSRTQSVELPDVTAPTAAVYSVVAKNAFSLKLNRWWCP